MTYTEKAIKRMVRVGYPSVGRFALKEEYKDDKNAQQTVVKHLVANIYEILLDPLAWQALGKAEGWGGKFVERTISAKTVSKVTRNGVVEVEYPEHTRKYALRSERWEKKMDSLMPHIRKGGDIESFFKEILK